MFNTTGFGMLIFGALVAAGINWLTGAINTALIVGGLLIIAMDFLARREEVGGITRFIDPRIGGTFLLLPLWGWGVFIAFSSFFA